VSEREREIYLGVATGTRRISASSGTGERSAFTIRGQLDPERWTELTTDQLALEGPRVLYACVAVPSGTTSKETEQIVRAGRSAGWDAILVVSTLLAGDRGGARDGWRAVIHLDHEQSSVGFLRGSRLEGHDRVRTIPGREARELAVSLRCLFKDLAEPRERLRAPVLVTGERDELERIGKRNVLSELEALGLRQVEFDLDPLRLARGAAAIAERTARPRWRRLRRAQK
jgi:hypothetical protein